MEESADRLHEALVIYTDVLDDEPDNFDALHMLGVAHYQLDNLATAESLLRRAIALEPSLVAPQRNLELVLDARRIVGREGALCRSVLPKLAKHCAPPVDWPAAVTERSGAVDDALTGRADDGGDLGSAPRLRDRCARGRAIANSVGKSSRAYSTTAAETA